MVWTLLAFVICLFKLGFRAKLVQIPHLKELFFSWTDAICPCKWCLKAKLASHTSHLNGFFLSLSDSICYKFGFHVKLASQMSHLNGFFPSWTDCKCTFKFGFLVKLLEQISHLKGFFPSWTDTICPCKLWVWGYINKFQIWKVYFLHEQILYVVSNYVCWWSKHHNCHI